MAAFTIWWPQYEKSGYAEPGSKLDLKMMRKHSRKGSGTSSDDKAKMKKFNVVMFGKNRDLINTGDYEQLVGNSNLLGRYGEYMDFYRHISNKI